VGPHRLVAAKMGSGCVNTTNTVATVMALNAVDRVISTGPAGGLTDAIQVGTWLRVEVVMAWQSGKAAAEGGRIFPGEKALRQVEFLEVEWPEGEWQKMPTVKLVSGEAFVAARGGAESAGGGACGGGGGDECLWFAGRAGGEAGEGIDSAGDQ